MDITSAFKDMAKKIVVPAAVTMAAASPAHAGFLSNLLHGGHQAPPARFNNLCTTNVPGDTTMIYRDRDNSGAYFRLKIHGATTSVEAKIRNPERDGDNYGRTLFNGSYDGDKKVATVDPAATVIGPAKGAKPVPAPAPDDMGAVFIEPLAAQAKADLAKNKQTIRPCEQRTTDKDWYKGWPKMTP